MTENGDKKPSVRKLTVDNFSVIKHAELEFGKITVLIGPQASGKSLLCKLAYFLQKVVIEIAEESIRENQSLESFLVRVAREFTFNWFPVFGLESGARIAYTDGRFSITMFRSASSPLPEKFETTRPFASATVSDHVSTAYEMALLHFREEKSSAGNADLSRYSREVSERLESLQSPESAIYSYIPSTRPFFISPQRALIATSQRLDPITIRFAQDFSFNFQKRTSGPELDNPPRSWIDEESRRVLQGEVRVIEDDQVLEPKVELFKADGGRLIPLSFLSSGTQELLPMLTLLRQYFAGSAAAETLNFPSTLQKRLFFIEEPETNIFPSTQYDMVRIFARMANEPMLDAHWVITTHSPYILSAFNNLIEAGQAARNNPQIKDEVAKIVPEQYWIKEGDFKAYAIEDGELKSILNESGFVEGNYLDQVSETISDEFDRLIKLEYDHAKAS
jgi:AAA15 family ATPase/GTPase